MNNNFVEPFSTIALTIGRVTPAGVSMLGTGFILRNDGLIATTHHVVGNDPSNLVILMPRKEKADSYQDLTDLSCELVKATIAEIDPLRDIAIIQADLNRSGIIPPLGTFDSSKVGDGVHIFGYPHCTHGRRAFTLQITEIGAKVLMGNQGIKSNHAVINIQARPGQSGSPVVNPLNGTILGMLIGAWVPGGAGLRLGDINPHELHQTTHCISAHHISEML